MAVGSSHKTKLHGFLSRRTIKRTKPFAKGETLKLSLNMPYYEYQRGFKPITEAHF